MKKEFVSDETLVQKMIMADLPIERKEALNALLPFQRDDFAGLFRVMDGLPVIIRLIDPPLHEFMPNHVDLISELADLKIRLKHAGTLGEINELLEQIKEKDRVLKRVESLREDNPMLGTRGVRLGILIPELTTMQVRAIFEAACTVRKEGVNVRPEVMIPLTCHVNELKVQRAVLETEAKKVMTEQDIEIDYKFGTMIELPRAALTAEIEARLLREARNLASIIGAEELSARDQRYLEFAKEFDAHFVGQGEDENRSIIETLNLAWELLSRFPRDALTRVSETDLAHYHRSGEDAA